MTIPPFALLLLAIPVLLAGEQLNARFKWLGRLNIPAPIISGLLLAIAILIFHKLSPGTLILSDRSASPVWQWIALPQWSGNAPDVWATKPPPYVYQPLLILFFTCIGLNASWAVARAGGVSLVVYLGIATLFGALQYFTGVLTAMMIGADPLVGIMCSGVSLMGGFGTATSWAPDFERHGLPGAPAIGIAAAAFGVVAGGLLAGPLSGRLVERKVKTSRAAPHVRPLELALPEDAEPPVVRPPHPHDVADELVDEGGFLSDVRNMFASPGATLVHLGVLAICLKLGAFLSAAVGGVRIGEQNLTFPVYMGSMIVAAILRNIHDLFGLRLLDTKHVDLIASFALAWMLACVMITLQLGQLAALAGPMLVILFTQVALMAAFAYWVVFRVMGRDYDAAAMSAGMVGFGLGATSNAVATMRQLARRYGPSPRAFLIVTVVGAFLIDFTNAFLIMGFLNWFKH